MLKTKYISAKAKVKKVPSTWVFENYLNLDEPLTGQDVKMLSVFSNTDTVPSMYLFCTENKEYRFKDWSGNKSGNHIDFVREYFNLDFDNACLKIVEDYYNGKSHDIDYIEREVVPRGKFLLHNYKVRGWTKLDGKYWTQYKINSKLLEFFCVKPLNYITLRNDVTGEEFQIKRFNLYGYFKKSGELYKIYQPLSKMKFFNVLNHIQGLDQLTFNKDYLVIGSSMKDILAFSRLNYKNIEVIAPNSENTVLSEPFIKSMKSQYKQVITLFDNDEAGIRSMLNYYDLYDLPGVHLKLEKDIADNVKIHGIRNTKELLTPKLMKAFKTDIL